MLRYQYYILQPLLACFQSLEGASVCRSCQNRTAEDDAVKITSQKKSLLLLLPDKE